MEQRQQMNLQPLQVLLNKCQKLLLTICTGAAQKQEESIHTEKESLMSADRQAALGCIIYAVIMTPI